MRASRTQPPQPLPLPLPLPPPPLSLPSPHATPRLGRHRVSSCSSSSSSSSSSVSAASSSSSSSFCPSPSPAASPRASTTTSVVPFSWERHPGVPKSSLRGHLAAVAASDAGAPLPLPPPLRQSPRRRRRRRANTNANVPAASSGPGTSSDPFVAAFAECTRDGDDVDDGTDHGAAEADAAVAGNKLWLARAKPATASGRAERRWWLAGGGLVGFLDLYGCKSAMAVADGTFLARRPVVAHGARASRR